MADVSGTISPAQASRLEASIRRYEAEIDSITRANASLRASIRSSASPLRLSRGSDLNFSSSRYEDPVRRKVESLEEYVETLEGRLRVYEASGEGNWHGTITRLREENVALREQVDSLLARLRNSDSASWESSRSLLETTIARLRTELRTETETNSKLRADYRTLEIRYERIAADYSSVTKARASESASFEQQEVVNRLRSELRLETEAHGKLKADYRALEGRYERLTAEYASLTKTKTSDSATYEDRIQTLETELRKYREERGELAERLKRVTREYKENEEDWKYRIELLEARNGSRNIRSEQLETGETRPGKNSQEERYRKRYENRHRRDLEEGKSEDREREEGRNSHDMKESPAEQRSKPDYEAEKLSKDPGNSSSKAYEPHSKPQKREKRPPSAKAYPSSKDKAERPGNESQTRLSELSPEQSQGDLGKSASAKSLSRSQKLKSKASSALKEAEMVYSCEACRRHPSPERFRRSSAKERK